MAKLVWAFNIVPEIANPDTDVTTAFAAGFAFGPKPFPVQFIPRSMDHANLIEREFSAVGDLLNQFEEVK